jgi:hypothetical protein
MAPIMTEALLLIMPMVHNIEEIVVIRKKLFLGQEKSMIFSMASSFSFWVRPLNN